MPPSTKRRQTKNPVGQIATTPLIYFSLFLSLFAISALFVFLFSTNTPPLVILGRNTTFQSPTFGSEAVATTTIQQIFGEGTGGTPGTGYEIPCMTDRPQTLENPYVPPVKKTDDFLPPLKTQPRPVLNDYSQMGILVRNGNSDMILPLMGRKLYSRRDKFQYYTISNTGNINTKLPVRHKRQNGMSEYGCDEIFSGDTVYVEGYKDLFEATIYENNTYTYNSLVV